MAVDPVALSKLIRDSGIPFRENAKSYVFTCPRCQKNGKLAMYKESGHFVCHHCKVDGFKGFADFALSELLGQPIGDIRKKIYGSDVPPTMGYLDIQLLDHWNESEDSLYSVDPRVLTPDVMWPPDYVTIDQPAAFMKGARYLHSRGLTGQHVRDYDIRYSPADQRVIFPVKVDGKLLGWQGRYIGQTKVWMEEQARFKHVPKVITSPSLQGKGKRWFMYQDRLKGSDHAVVTEGPITGLKAHKCGGNVVAMGKDLTPEQIDILRRSVSKIYLALDPDAGDAIVRVMYDLGADKEFYLMPVPQNFLNFDDPANEKDHGDFSDDEVHEVFLRAKPEPLGRLYVSVGGIFAY